MSITETLHVVTTLLEKQKAEKIIADYKVAYNSANPGKVDITYSPVKKIEHIRLDIGIIKDRKSAFIEKLKDVCQYAIQKHRYEINDNRTRNIICQEVHLMMDLEYQHSYKNCLRVLSISHNTFDGHDVNMIIGCYDVVTAECFDVNLNAR